jgi:hypothetical protein
MVSESAYWVIFASVAAVAYLGYRAISESDEDRSSESGTSPPESAAGADGTALPTDTQDEASKPGKEQSVTSPDTQSKAINDTKSGTDSSSRNDPDVVPSGEGANPDESTSSADTHDDDRTVILKKDGSEQVASGRTCPNCSESFADADLFCPGCGELIHTDSVFLQFPETQLLADIGMTHGANLRRELAGNELPQTEASKISNEHFRFESESGQIYFVDTDSTNGSSLNGTAVRPNERTPVKSGDTLSIASVVQATIRLPP